MRMKWRMTNTFEMFEPKPNMESIDANQETIELTELLN